MEQLIAAHLPQILESVACLLGYIALRRIGRFFVRSAVVRSAYKAGEEGSVLRLLDLLFLVVLALVLAAIWGMKQNEILLFATSVITVLGVAFFAEMSILSNVTASVVLFFQHPVKVGDRIRVQFEGQELEGELVDITYFFVFLRTDEGGTISLPNAVLLKNAFTIVAPPRP
ncbi:MAG: mechanosensitive ion channel domain-containing protein [Flavobacteriales bacterium]